MLGVALSGSSCCRPPPATTARSAPGNRAPAHAKGERVMNAHWGLRRGLLSTTTTSVLKVPADTSILHHAFISIFIALWAITTHYISNTYGCYLLFYKVYHEEGECRQLEFWLEKEQTLETYSAQLQNT